MQGPTLFQGRGVGGTSTIFGNSQTGISGGNFDLNRREKKDANKQFV
jgi:hypothetical protein